VSARGERDVPVLRVELHASRALTCALLLAHLAAATAAGIALPWYGAALAGSALVANAVRVSRRHAVLLAPHAVVAIELRGEAQCRIERRNARSADCHVLGSSYVSTWLVILHLEQEGTSAHHHVVVAPDSMSPDRFRRLRVRLRWAVPHDTVAAGRNPPL
jgi:hypothetical protein